MEDLTLVIGNKNYSSWSLRPWLLMKRGRVPFREIRIPLYRAESAVALSEWSPHGLVPVLHDHGLIVWDSLAIAEYIAERFPDRGLWPLSREARAVARSASAEMHAGFGALRRSMPMNCRRHLPGLGRNEESERDIQRVVALWRSCRERYGHGGPYLFGRFSVADAMFAPVVLRFRTYAVELEGDARAYADAILAMPEIGAWVEAARAESEVLEQFELQP